MTIGTTTFDTETIDLREGARRRQAEREAVGLVLRRLLGHDTTIGHHPDGSPFVEGNDMHISISHSPLAAAVAIDTAAPVGIDIESAARAAQLARVAPRVMSQAELRYWSALPQGLLRAWTMKEALYKVAAEPGIDWRTGLRLPLDEKETHARAGARACEIVYSHSHQGGWLTVVRQSLVP